jgi:hypothetical protein
MAEPGHLKGLIRRSTDVDEPQLSRDVFCGAMFSLSSSCETDFGRNLQKSQLQRWSVEGLTYMTRKLNCKMDMWESIFELAFSCPKL